ncbi:diguanylate phosphodiesterase [Parafrankia soli]|uniref:Diguanylate phosphodiesterase n=1 Tax=Parafrankia soli TaxID=2599596 RepID=A0A1S1PMR4_9ACTN|nr:EAL domain-containing protein [Parafrankia soli]OHV22970.1 diguanylate phosphodiesterase [Parafrankia soli]
MGTRMASKGSCLGPRINVSEPGSILPDLVAVLRRRLRMDVGWLGRFVDDLLVLEVLCGDAGRFGLSPYSTVRRPGSLWGAVERGDLPSLVPDTRADPRAAELAGARELGVRAFAAAMLTDSEGEPIGMIGCMGSEPIPALPQHDGGFLRLLARFLTDFVIDVRDLWDRQSRTWREIRAALDGAALRTTFQPVVDLHAGRRGRVVAVEALTTFPVLDSSPEDVFKKATTVGLGPELELAALGRAVQSLPDIPPGITLAINLSAAALADDAVELILSTGSPERLAVEITEHEYMVDSDNLARAFDTLRGHGTHIAVDDVGTGYAGLEQLLRLRPDIIKIDRFITHGIDRDPARRAVAAGLTTVAAAIDAKIVAEGVESHSEVEALRDAHIRYAQGYLLGRPTPDIHDACSRRPRCQQRERPRNG